MPPEPYQWDRRDFRKHERSASDTRLGGGFGGGGPPRWRDQHHHNAPPAHPPSYHQNHHHQQQQRWNSDFRTRSLPPAHGRQAGWSTYPDEGSHAFLPFGSRFIDRNLEEENFRPYRSCSDAGRYVRNSRENRMSFRQKDWKATSWEPFTASTHGRLNTETNDQRLVENNKTSHERNSVTNCPKSENLSPPSDSLNPLEPSCPVKKERQDKKGGNSDELCSNGLESTWKLEKGNILDSIDWKPLKWSRSGSLSSRGSSLSCSSSSKSMAGDSVETVAEVHEKKMAPVQSPTTEAVACVMTAAPDSSEETSSRKKPRLGWGEGLAKYEKKKVDSPEDSAAKNGLVIGLSNIEETVQCHDMNLLDKSPRVAGFLDFALPATPSSVGCSSSTGIEEKESCRAVNVDHDTANLSCSPCIVSQTSDEGPIFNLEKLELTSFASVSSLIRDLLQSDDLSSRGSNYLGANSMNKLLLWKVDALKALEITETEIDLLETELKSLIPLSWVSCPHQDASSLQPRKFPLKPCKEQGTPSDFSQRPTPLRLVSSGDMIVENTPGAVEDEYVRLKSENFDSPSSATSKYVEVSPSGDDVYPSQTTQGFVNLDVKNPSNLNEKYVGNGLCEEENIDCAEEYCGSTCINSCSDLDRVMDDDICDIYDSILASNRVNANEASEVLNKLLPSEQCMAGSEVSCRPSIPSAVKKKYFIRKQFLRFKEKVLTIKYKLFQHFWIEGRLLSVWKLRAKSHKRLDLIGHKKHRYGRSRICYPAVPAEDVVDFVSGLLSESSFKPCRNALKMPALILDKKEMRMSRFITSNGLVEDPRAVEKERFMINTWTPAEREIFIDKLATFGKDFRKIASFLDHKTIADCVEFYYKSHKSDSFEKARKKPEAVKQRKSQSTRYLVASGKRWNREAVAASLDILGEASAIAANADGIENQKGASRFSFGASGASKAPRCYDDQAQRSNSLDFYGNEREAVAADVLAGICGSLSSEAMSSCVTSSFDPGDGYQDSRCQRVGFSVKRSLNPEITQIVDDECSDESCGEMDPTDWTDVEKSIFIQAVSSYGKDFGMISRCVRTRSRDQCKVFFSKSRKCLGLDLILPGFHNAVSGDVNGGGSDIEDASVVETGSIIYNEGSGGKTEENLPCPGWKSSHASNVKSGTPSLKPDSKRCEELNGLNSPDPMDAELGVNSLLLDNPQLVDKPFSGFNGQSGATDVTVPVKEIGIMGVSSVAESLPGVEEANDNDLPYGSTRTEKVTLIQISDGHRGNENEGSDLLLAEDKSAYQKVEEKEADSTEVSGTDWSVTKMKSESQHTESASCPSVDVHSSMQVYNVSGCQKKAHLLSTTEDTSHIRSVPQDGHMASLRSSTLFSVPIKYQKLSYHNELPSVGINGADDDHCDCQQQHISGHSLSDHVESSQILRGYPVSVPMMNKEVNGCVGCQKKVLPQDASLPDGNLHTAHHAEPLLKKCDSSGHHTKMFEVPHPVHDQTCEQRRPQPSCSSSFGKPSGNGDVKLFGKILVSSQQNQNSCGQQTDDNNGQNHKSGSPLSGQKFNNEQNVSFDSSVSKFDRHNYLGSDNIQTRNFSFWDGNGMKAGLPSIPDSTLLLSKYPAAFSNYSIPAVKIEHPPLHGIVTCNDCTLNGVSIYPAKDLCSSNGIADYLKNQGQKPFTINMKNPQATLFPEMRRQNVFHIIPGMQQQSRGLAEMNIGRGVIVGGQCSTISDPVVAIKMHYAKTEQFNLQAGKITKDDDTWRSKGDVGR
ncbi:LOW QUALITY PROTEIN: uncharacterized protein LOC142524213 [Primulina tabacum]|uniref:LOW QUALITY PROTEIN: uncharacterized protein LOC142524213 n=1 Tax=Primulina tabacum TaxID=48773 RepID=UPI003F59FAE2